MMKLDPLIELPSVTTAAWSRFGVHLFCGHLSMADMDRLEEVGDRWNEKNPGRTAELSIIYPSRARMSTTERMRMARLLKKYQDHRDAAATVILAEGLTGSVHRSVLTGLLFLAPPPHPAKVFGKRGDAVAWLQPYVQKLCGADATAGALGAAVDELCAKFQARVGAAG